ncbi:hypothetical protein D915_007028 [Fasciola hepatica]|uniref:G-protein coupled receptors family 1 profile domain-containing protein n=1 Tax=Fasciola hepatica TaxID=6192 RepID=A0A4E0RWM6_FASHE|nr:hypothetical protein D915_007028 [Fasciola hepatica]
MDLFYNLDELPTVTEALKMPYQTYLKHARGVLEFKEYCQMGLTESLEKVHEWCVHLKCLSAIDPCIPSRKNDTADKLVFLQSSVMITPYPTDSIGNASFLDANSSIFDKNHSVLNFMKVFGYNKSKCYDDYLCDQVEMSGPNHGILGFTCFILCLYGIVSNLVLLPAYNIGLNRSGATIYLSAMSIFDIAYMALTLLVVTSRYMPADFSTQMETYAQFSARFVPIGAPIMLFCELVVVWLTVALLANRLLYLKFGFQSKYLCSQLQSVKSITALVLFGLAYASCKMLEYTLIKNDHMNVFRVVLTPIGNTSLYKNLMYHWLKVPLQMFLPYLSVGLLVSLVVTKMLNLHKSKWKAVASLCNDTACACVCRTGVCGNECQEGVSNPTKWSRSQSPEFGSKRYSTEKTATETNPVFETQPTAKLLPGQLCETLDHIEEELSYLYFQLPQVDETREHANVITTVCIGLLLLILKVPKFILHILSTEDYIVYNPTIFALTDQVLDTIFAACKPTVCILVGAHFRQALIAPRLSCYSSERETPEMLTAKSPSHPKAADLQLTERSSEKNHQLVLGNIPAV